MWRQGDVFIQACNSIPEAAKKLPHLILARGEITGHAHRIEDSEAADLLRDGEMLYLRVKCELAILKHEEHGPISLRRGVYRAWIQREYSPQQIRRVLD
jgi:hypothetical protein